MIQFKSLRRLLLPIRYIYHCAYCTVWIQYELLKTVVFVSCFSVIHPNTKKLNQHGLYRRRQIDVQFVPRQNRDDSASIFMCSRVVCNVCNGIVRLHYCIANNKELLVCQSFHPHIFFLPRTLLDFYVQLETVVASYIEGAGSNLGNNPTMYRGKLKVLYEYIRVTYHTIHSFCNGVFFYKIYTNQHVTYTCIIGEIMVQQSIHNITELSKVILSSISYTFLPHTSSRELQSLYIQEDDHSNDQ